MNPELLVQAIVAVFVVVVLASLWKVFEKAGEPGWKGIIPLYNLWVLLGIIGAPKWLIVGVLIPGVNTVVGMYVYYKLARVFGYGAGFGILSALLPMVTVPIIGFGSSEYEGEAGASSGEPLDDVDV